MGLKRRTTTRMIKVFVYSVASILLLTACAKIAASFGSIGILKVYDPLLTFLTVRQLVLAAAFLEIGASVFIWLNAGSEDRQLMAIAWISTVFICFRFGRFFGGFIEPCHCLGRVPEVIGLRPEFADNFIELLLGYMFILSYGLLFRSVFKIKKAAKSVSL